MKRKRMGIVLVAVLLISFAMGMSGVVTLAGEETTVLPGEEISKDRLIGVFLTEEYLDLFDFESYFEDNADKILSGGEISVEDSEEYSRRIYATLVDREGTDSKRQEYVFEGLKGIRCFAPVMEDEEGPYTTNCIDKEVSATVMNSYSGDNEMERIELEGTVYLALTKDVDTVDGVGFYFNPVYQTPEGEVYLTAGEGLFHSGDISEGASFSHEMKEEKKRTTTENGEETEQEISGSRVKITLEYRNVPETIRIVQMSEENTVLSYEEYKPGTVPMTLTSKAGTAYIVVETDRKDATGQTIVKREFFQKEDTGFGTQYSIDGKYLLGKFTEIDWQKINKY